MNDILDFDPRPPDCMECEKEIDGIYYGRIECLEQNGGYEWWVYCPDCKVETFSQTFKDMGV